MKYLYQFALRCLCLGSLVSMPFGLKAIEPKVIEVTFDAKDYQSDEDWKGCIEALYGTLSEHPDYKAAKQAGKEGGIRFDLTILNGDIFGTKPKELSEYFPNKDKCLRMKKMLRAVSILHLRISKFLPLVRERLFYGAETIFLIGTKTIEGSAEGGCKFVIVRTFDRFPGTDLSDDALPTEWSQFVDELCRELGRYPDSENVRFRLCFGDNPVFGRAPGNTDYLGNTDYVGCLGKAERELTGNAKILSRIDLLNIDTQHFSTVSLSKIFPRT